MTDEYREPARFYPKGVLEFSVPQTFRGLFSVLYDVDAASPIERDGEVHRIYITQSRIVLMPFVLEFLKCKVVCCLDDQLLEMNSSETSNPASSEIAFWYIHLTSFRCHRQDFFVGTWAESTKFKDK